MNYQGEVRYANVCNACLRDAEPLATVYCPKCERVKLLAHEEGHGDYAMSRWVQDTVEGRDPVPPGQWQGGNQLEPLAGWIPPPETPQPLPPAQDWVMQPALQGPQEVQGCNQWSPYQPQPQLHNIAVEASSSSSASMGSPSPGTILVRQDRPDNMASASGPLSPGTILVRHDGPNEAFSAAGPPSPGTMFGLPDGLDDVAASSASALPRPGTIVRRQQHAADLWNNEELMGEASANRKLRELFQRLDSSLSGRHLEKAMFIVYWRAHGLRWSDLTKMFNACFHTEVTYQILLSRLGALQKRYRTLSAECGLPRPGARGKPLELILLETQADGHTAHRPCSRQSGPGLLH